MILAREHGRSLANLLARYALSLEWVADRQKILGSFWGAPEAGLISSTLYLRSDTPLHSVLHEAAHFICMDPRRRTDLHTDAGGDDLEESAVCYLQLLLGQLLLGPSTTRLFDDMDAWGYSFRLGSTKAWFERDSTDARRWLAEHGLITMDGGVAFTKRYQP